MTSPNHSSARPMGVAWVSDAGYSRLLGGMICVLIVLMIVPDGFDYQSLVGRGTTSSGGALGRLLWLGLLVLGSGVVLWRASLAWYLVRTLNPFFPLFIALAFISIAWSIDPSLSLRRLIRMGTITLACTAFALAGWHARRFQRVVRPVLTIMLAGSIVFGLTYPSLAIHQQLSSELAGAWRGLANHKNSLGALASMAVIMWFHAWLIREVSHRRALACGALAAACLLLSRSSTALFTTLFGLLLLLLLLRSPRSLRPYLPFLVWLLVAPLLLYALAVMNVIPGLDTLMAPISSLTSKDATLTGRTEIWAILGDHIRLHPLLGTGYAAYWTPEPVSGTDAYQFVLRMGSFYPGSAHNGYLEVANDLGWIGFTCLFGYILVHVRQTLQLFRIEGSQAALYLALFFQQALTNFSESHWFSVLSVSFIVMTLTTMAVARDLLEYRLRHAFGPPTSAFVRHVPRLLNP